MQQLEKRVLCIGADTTPHHWAGAHNRCTVHIHRFAVALHHELLQIRRQQMQRP